VSTSKEVGWVEDVVRAGVRARPCPDVRGWVLLSRVRSSGESPRAFVPSGVTGQGKTGHGVNVSEALLMPRQANAL
jgi:hypothetical protein